MPTIYGMELPQPSNWQDFELITLDAMKLKWKSPNLHRNGRAGQAQYGVDIYGADDLGRPVGIQCKNTTTSIKFKTIVTEIANAENFRGLLTTLYIATTAAPDQALQGKVRGLSIDRASLGKFVVGLLYWEDIYSGLALDRTVFANHYPDFKVSGTAENGNSKSANLSALLVGYFGGFLWDFVELTFGEYGWLAQVDPEEVRTMIRRIRNNLTFASAEDRGELSVWLNEVEVAIFTTNGAVEWDRVELISKRVEQRIAALSSLASNADITNFVEIGTSLGALYHGEGKFTERQSDLAYRQIRSVLPESDGRLVDLLKDLRGKERYTAAPALYTFISRELRWPLPHS